jgi:hypothetical protein
MVNLYYSLRRYCRRPQIFLVHGSADGSPPSTPTPPSSPSNPRLPGTEATIRKVPQMLLISCCVWKVPRIPPPFLAADPPPSSPPPVMEGATLDFLLRMEGAVDPPPFLAADPPPFLAADPPPSTARHGRCRDMEAAGRSSGRRRRAGRGSRS